MAILVAGALPLACADEAPLGPVAARCGQVVAFYLGVQAAVEVTGGEVDEKVPRARIDYATARDGSPAEGVALCRFQRSEEGDDTLTLTGAFVDDNRMRPDEVAAFNERGPRG